MAVARAREALEARIELAQNAAIAFARQEIMNLESRLSGGAGKPTETRAALLAASEALETRIDLAAREAIAFAEHGLLQQQGALRLLGRRVADLAKERSARPQAPWTAPANPPTEAYLIGGFAPEWRDCRQLEIRDDGEDAFLGDLADLPIPPGGAAKLVVAHIIEFLAPAVLSEVLLPHWRTRLAPGGELVIVTLDGPAWTADFALDAADFERMRARVAASSPRPVRGLFDYEALRDLLQSAGFCSADRGPGTDGVELRVVARTAA